MDANNHDLHRDWDTSKASLEEYQDAYRKQKREALATFAVNFFFNILLMLPLWTTGLKNMIEDNPPLPSYERNCAPHLSNV